jgi:hypothetical protein
MVAGEFTDLAFMSCTKGVCNMGGRGIIVEMESKKFAGFDGARVNIGGDWAGETQGHSDGAGDTHDGWGGRVEARWKALSLFTMRSKGSKAQLP